MSNYYKGVLLIGLSALCWSSAGLFIKLVELPAVHIAMYRSMVAGIFLTGYVIYQIRVKQIPFKIEVSRSSFVTALFYVFTVSLFVTANKLTSSANAVFLQYTAPAYVIAISYFYFHEKVSASEILTVIICFAGMMLFFVDQEKSSAVLGNIFGILSGVAFALLQVSVKHMGDPTAKDPRIRDVQSIFAVCIGNLLTTALTFLSTLLVFNFFSGNPSLNPIFGESFGMSGRDLLGLLFLGIVQLAFGYLFFAYGSKYIASVEIAIFTLLEPILNPVWTFLGTGELPGFWPLIGAGLIVAAMIIHAWFERPKAT